MLGSLLVLGPILGGVHIMLNTSQFCSRRKRDEPHFQVRKYNFICYSVLGTELLYFQFCWGTEGNFGFRVFHFHEYSKPVIIIIQDLIQFTFCKVFLFTDSFLDCLTNCSSMFNVPTSGNSLRPLQSSGG